MKGIIYFFDKLEDRVRARLSHYPIFYAIVGGVGIVLFWRGVWLTTDYFFETLSVCWNMSCSTINAPGISWWDGPLSFLLGLAILLIAGVFVSNFIGNEIIITGLRGEKKLTERTEQEERFEVGVIGEIREEMRKISVRLDDIESFTAKPKK